MNGCANTLRPGCREALCRGAHAHLRRLTVLRCPVDDNGCPDLSVRPERGWVCALTGTRRSSQDGSIDIPGTLGGDAMTSLTVAAGSLEPPVACGDRVLIDARSHRVCSVSGRAHPFALLLPEEEL